MTPQYISDMNENNDNLIVEDGNSDEDINLCIDAENERKKREENTSQSMILTKSTALFGFNTLRT